ncbi:hypothetical protein ACR80S_12775 [Halomonas sp. MA07-2]|uniref:hypothetical protein n=1 Tax=unclassified Halomonas TaxID=2609666 RepID=UPI003EEDAFFB
MKKRIYVDKANLYALAVASIVFVLSMIVSPFYIYGDQEFYRLVYDVIPNLNFADAAFFYQRTLSSNEIVHFSLVYFLGGVMSKEVMMSALNFLLAFASFRLLVNLGAYKSVAIFIVLTNFYLWILYLHAERLKVACILMFFAWMVFDKRFRFVVLSAIGLLAHVSTIIIFISSLLVYARDEIKQFFTGLRLNKVFFIALPLMAVVLVFSITQLYDKFLAYTDDADMMTVGQALRMLVFFGMSLIYAKKKSDVVIVYAFLMSMVVMFSGDRINMFGYLVFLFFSVHHRGGLNIGVVLTSLYFMTTTFGMVDRVVEYGNAFHGLLD